VHVDVSVLLDIVLGAIGRPARAIRIVGRRWRIQVVALLRRCLLARASRTVEERGVDLTADSDKEPLSDSRSREGLEPRDLGDVGDHRSLARRRVHVQASHQVRVRRRRLRGEVARADRDRSSVPVCAGLILRDRLVQGPLERPVAGDVKIDADVHPDAAKLVKVGARR